MRGNGRTGAGRAETGSGRALALCLALLAAAPREARAAEGSDLPEPSPVARRAFENARTSLIQVRTVLAGKETMASSGTGFLVTADGHAITNYHVVSQVALEPQRYRLTYSAAGGGSGALELLAFDIVHDLALVRLAGGPRPAGLRALPFRPRQAALSRGDRLISMGYPLGVGLAVVEGSYNGMVEHSFKPRIFFGGSLNPGMSGGPVLDAEGRIAGVNVAKRTDGEQVGFLVPAGLATELLERGRTAAPLREPAHPELARQLTLYQAELVDAFVASGWRDAGSDRYALPQPSEDAMRCGGSTSDARGLRLVRGQCRTEHDVSLGFELRSGTLATRYEEYLASKLGAARFLRRYSAGFRNEGLGSGNRQRTAARCRERDVDRDGLPLRVVLCASAYRKLPGLYDVTVLVATLDQAEGGVQGRLDARGVSWENGLRLADFYLKGFGWKPGSR